MTRYIAIEISDFEYVCFKEVVSDEYYRATFNNSNYNYTIEFTEDDYFEIRDILQDYLLDENTVVGCVNYNILSEIACNIREEYNWFELYSDDEEEEEDEEEE